MSKIASSLYNLLLTANSRTASSSNLEAMGKGLLLVLCILPPPLILWFSLPLEDHHDQPPHVTQIDLERAAILMGTLLLFYFI